MQTGIKYIQTHNRKKRYHQHQSMLRKNLSIDIDTNTSFIASISVVNCIYKTYPQGNPNIIDHNEVINNLMNMCLVDNQYNRKPEQHENI